MKEIWCQIHLILVSLVGVYFLYFLIEKSCKSSNFSSLNKFIHSNFIKIQYWRFKLREKVQFVRFYHCLSFVVAWFYSCYSIDFISSDFSKCQILYLFTFILFFSLSRSRTHTHTSVHNLFVSNHHHYYYCLKEKRKFKMLNWLAMNEMNSISLQFRQHKLLFIPSPSHTYIPIYKSFSLSVFLLI